MADAPTTITEPAYARDAYGWALHQASLLRQGRLAELDVVNIAEEIESMGRAERRELGSRLAVLLTHLLKWQYQPGHRGASWAATVDEQRAQSMLLLRDNPSLAPLLPEIVADAYAIAVRVTARQTGLVRATFPHTCPYAVVSALDEAFWPGA